MQKKTQESAKEDFSNSGKTGKALQSCFEYYKGHSERSRLVSWFDGV